MKDSIILQYTPEEIYFCFQKTVAASKKRKDPKLKEDAILDVLENTKEYKGIKDYIYKYIDYAHKPSRNLRILSGPDTVLFFRNVEGRRVLLLGETHHVSKVCDDKVLKRKNAFEVHEWLASIGMYAPTCLDIFTETSYKFSRRCEKEGKLKKDFENPLTAVECKFYMLQKNKNMPNYVRYHNVDTRKYEGTTSAMEEFIYLRSRYAIPEPYLQEKLIRHRINKRVLINYMLTADRSLDAKMIYDSYMKDLYELLNPVVGKNLYEFHKSDFQKTFNKYVATIDKEFTKSSLDKDKTFALLLDIYEKSGYFIGLLNIPMDLYFLTRLFIKFDENKLSRGPVGCRKKSDTYVTNAIFYGGGAHANVYGSFI